MSYIIAAFTTALLILGGALWYQGNHLKLVEAELVTANARLSACGGRLQTVLDDVRSDNAIDTLPDSALRDVPDNWMRPTSTPD